jgi:hypothetical protein
MAETTTIDILDGDTRDGVLRRFAQSGDRSEIDGVARDALGSDDPRLLVVTGAVMATALLISGNRVEAGRGAGLALDYCEAAGVEPPAIVLNVLAALVADVPSDMVRALYASAPVG